MRLINLFAFGEKEGFSMKIMTKILMLVIYLVAHSVAAVDEKNKPNSVSGLKVTTLSTMLASRGIGEWGYAALVEVDGNQILFDTGYRPQTVLQNAKELGVDLSRVEHVILSHNHGDHTGGLETLRKALKEKNPKALSKIHVGKGIFAQRVGRSNRMMEIKKRLESDGVTFYIHEDASEIFPGVWLTGNVERKSEEKNWSGRGQIHSHDGVIEDIVKEDLSLAIYTNKGFVLISGCGHAGIINTMEHIVAKIHKGKIDTAIGGFHLINADDDQLKWTATKLKYFGLNKMVGAHCTGLNSLYSLRNLLGGNRKTFVVGSVGDQFDIDSGIRAGSVAR